MKIFNVENGKEKVYVQMEDIMLLMHYDLNTGIPASIFDKLFSSGAVFVSDHNRFEFVSFDEENEIEFFRNIDWIVDYKEYRTRSFDEMVQAGEDIHSERKDIADRYNAMDEIDRKNNQQLRTQFDLLEEKFKFLPQIVFVNQGHVTMPFPNVVDSDGFDCGSDETFDIKSSIDPNKVIISRKDGQPINNGKINRNLLKNILANVSVGMAYREEYCRIVRTKQSISQDGKSLTIEFIVKPINKNMEHENSKTNEKGFVKKIKGILGIK